MAPLIQLKLLVVYDHLLLHVYICVIIGMLVVCIV